MIFANIFLKFTYNSSYEGKKQGYLDGVFYLIEKNDDTLRKKFPQLEQRGSESDTWLAKMEQEWFRRDQKYLH